MTDPAGAQRPEPSPPPTGAWPGWQQQPLPPTGAYYPQQPPPPGYYPPPPGPYPGTYGQPPWPPGGYGPPPPFPDGRRRGRRGRLIGVIGTAVVLAVLGITAFWAPGFLRTSELDVTAVQDGVRQVLTDTANGYGAGEVTDVRCNNGANPVIESGATFGCEATINGTQRHLEVTFADDRGTYWVGAPS